MNDIDKIARVFKSKFAGKPIDIGSYGYDNIPVDAINAVICLNRKFDTYIKPKLDRFLQANPDMILLSQLKELILSYPTIYDFMLTELAYKFEEKGRAILLLTDYLFMVKNEYHGNTEKERLRNWAKSVIPSDYRKLDIFGFGIAGFQQLRMLYGAQTAKPDKHIKDFITEIIGRKLSDLKTIEYFETAANRYNLPVRDIDALIWRERARKKKKEKKCT